MPEFEMSFTVESRHVGDVMIAVLPYKVKDLDVKPLVRRGGKGKAGGVPAWQMVADYVASVKGPVQSKQCADALQAKGFNRSGISTHLAKAVKAKLIRSTAKGYVATMNGGAK